MKKQFKHHWILACLTLGAAVILRIPSSSRASVQPGPNGTLVGAIRWDAWNGDASSAGLAVEKSLGPEQWHYRLPFFAQELSSTQAQTRGNTQAIVDQEINYASAAGLDYWAFGFYPAGTTVDSWQVQPTNYGLKYYLSSSHKTDINFCLIFNTFGQAANWNSTVQQAVVLMQNSSYQKVAGGRPLIYLFSNPTTKFGSIQAGKDAIDKLRTSAQAAGLANPYIATMVFDAGSGDANVSNYGLDAISAYANLDSQQNQQYSYTQLAASNRTFWDAAKNTGRQVIPIVSTGWDPRPRYANPVPWDPNPVPGAWYASPTGAEFASNLLAAINWNKANPSSTNANAVIIYAWNEFDEGGWLAPTKGFGNNLLNAAAGVLGGRQIAYTWSTPTPQPTVTPKPGPTATLTPTPSAKPTVTPAQATPPPGGSSSGSPDTPGNNQSILKDGAESLPVGPFIGVLAVLGAVGAAMSLTHFHLAVVKFFQRRPK